MNRTEALCHEPKDACFGDKDTAATPFHVDTWKKSLIFLELSCDFHNQISLMKISLLLSLLFLLSVPGIYATEIDLDGHGTLSLDRPKGWNLRSEPAVMPDGKQIGHTLEIKPPGEINAKCLMSLVYTNTGSPNQERIRNQTLESCERFVAESVEQKKNLKDFALKSGYGAYCLFTDASLVGKPAAQGNYKAMASGLIEPGKDLVGVVSMFADDGNGAEFQAMLKTINSLNLKAGIAAGDGDAITIPGQGWKVTYDAPPLQYREGGNQGTDYRFRGGNEKFNLSLFVETPQKSGGGSKECCEFYWTQSAQNPLIKEGSVKATHTDIFYRVEYLMLIPRSERGLLNVNYYFAFKGKWMDLHLSLVGSSEENAEILKRFDDSLAYKEDGRQ